MVVIWSRAARRRGWLGPPTIRVERQDRRREDGEAAQNLFLTDRTLATVAYPFWQAMKTYRRGAPAWPQLRGARCTVLTGSRGAEYGGYAGNGADRMSVVSRMGEVLEVHQTGQQTAELWLSSREPKRDGQLHP